MKLLRIATIVLIILIVTTMTTTIILTQKYGSIKGEIKDTGFVIQEFSGVGGDRFDVDDYGNIYFAIMTLEEKGIVIYNYRGDYKYTLPFRSGGGIGARIDNENNILICDARDNAITFYNSKGYYVKTENNIEYKKRMEFFNAGNVRERNGIRYINKGGTIIKEENGIESVVFTVPIWQRWNGMCSLIMILSVVALFLRIAIPLWIKAYKKRYG